MSAKETAAVGQLLELLESRYALRVMWALKDGHPQTFRILQDSIGTITPNTLNTRIKELREVDIIERTNDGYQLTQRGEELMELLRPFGEWSWVWSKEVFNFTKHV